MTMGTPSSLQKSPWIAHLTKGPKSVVSHGTAASLWGFSGTKISAPTVTVPNGRGYRCPQEGHMIETHQSRVLTEMDIRHLDGCRSQVLPERLSIWPRPTTVHDSPTSSTTSTSRGSPRIATSARPSSALGLTGDKVGSSSSTCSMNEGNRPRSPRVDSSFYSAIFYNVAESPTTNGK